MLSMQEWQRLLERREARLILSVAGLLAFIAVGLYVVGKIRNLFRSTEAGAGDLLNNFRDLHSQGELSDEEFRTIKAKLAAKLRAEFDQAKPKRPEKSNLGE